MPETQPIDAFLNDPEFSLFVGGRVDSIKAQILAKVERLELLDVDSETGAKVLTHYAYVRRTPEQPATRRDLRGTRVWEAEDPLYRNPDAVIGAASLQQQIDQLWDGNHPKYRLLLEVLLLTHKEILDNEEHARALIVINGFNWIYLSDRLKVDPALAMLAIQHDDSVFSFILRDDVKPPITVDMAREAVARNPRMAEYVPAEMRPLL